MLAASSATIWCWAMGLTQHYNSVATIREVVNLALARGDLGKPAPGCARYVVTRTCRVTARWAFGSVPPAWFLDAIATEFDFEPPRHHGFDAVETIEAMAKGRVKVFVGLGGNFAHAAPDTGFTTEALQATDLTVQISTKLNRSHAVCGATALILPTLGRTELDIQRTGPQRVTVEDSMSSVHLSRGRLQPASKMLRSEVSIICGIAAATFRESALGIDWGASPMTTG